MYRYLHTTMSIAQEVFSKVSRLQSYRLGYSSTILNNVNDIWSDFVFKDVKKAEKLRIKGYDFTLVGQDIYERAVDSELPTGHYSYLLLVTYKQKLINPLEYKVDLKTVLHNSLSTEYMDVPGCPVVYSSVCKKTISANVFVCTYRDTGDTPNLKLNSILGDSLIYIGVSIPYLRFGSEVPVRFCKNRVDKATVLNIKSTVNMTFDTHMESIMAETVFCSFII